MDTHAHATGFDIELSDRPVIAICASGHEQIEREVRRWAPEADVRQVGRLGDESAVEALICWNIPGDLLGRLTGLKLIQSTGAGIDGILREVGSIGDTPVCRTIDSALSGGMAGYVSWAVIDHERRMTGYRQLQRERRWAPQPVTVPHDHQVGFAGVGQLGSACLRAVASLGFRTRAWSLSSKSGLPAETAQFAGAAELQAFLGGCDTLVCLLPLTPVTSGFLCSTTFNSLRVGAHVINVARGEHLIEEDLIRALDRKQLSRATLDVFRREPLPVKHPFWHRSDIVMTPHIASRATPAEIARQTLSNLAVLKAGKVPRYVANLANGY